MNYNNSWRGCAAPTTSVWNGWKKELPLKRLLYAGPNLSRLLFFSEGSVPHDPVDMV